MIFCLEVLEFIRPLSLGVLGLDTLFTEAVYEKEYL